MKKLTQYKSMVEDSGLSGKALAKRLGVCPQTISNRLNCKAKITNEAILAIECLLHKLKFERYFNDTPD